MKKILIIEDDSSLVKGLCKALSSEELHTVGCCCIREARHLLFKDSYALVLLDINLSDGNGLDFLQEIKKIFSVPAILLTANDMETDIVIGLEFGADDYITKPFSLAVLRARVNTVLRRNDSAESYNSLFQKQARFSVDDYFFDFDKMEFSYHGEKIELSKTEQKLLRIFF